jgi:hypothetical protein
MGIFAALCHLSGLSRRTDKFSQGRNIWAVGADSRRVNGQTQLFSRFHVDSRVVEFGEAKPNGWKHALRAAWVNRSRRAAPLPGLVCDCEELVPIVLIPHRSLPRLGDPGRSDPHSIRCANYPCGRFPWPVSKVSENCNGLYSDIRHSPGNVQNRLRIVSSALRKRNYHVGWRCRYRIGTSGIFEQNESRRGLSFHVKQFANSLWALRL